MPDGSGSEPVTQLTEYGEAIKELFEDEAALLGYYMSCSDKTDEETWYKRLGLISEGENKNFEVLDDGKTVKLMSDIFIKKGTEETIVLKKITIKNEYKIKVDKPKFGSDIFSKKLLNQQKKKKLKEYINKIKSNLTTTKTNFIIFKKNVIITETRQFNFNASPLELACRYGNYDKIWEFQDIVTQILTEENKMLNILTPEINRTENNTDSDKIFNNKMKDNLFLLIHPIRKIKKIIDNNINNENIYFPANFYNPTLNIILNKLQIEFTKILNFLKVIYVLYYLKLINISQQINNCELKINRCNFEFIIKSEDAKYKQKIDIVINESKIDYCQFFNINIQDNSNIIQFESSNYFFKLPNLIENNLIKNIIVKMIPINYSDISNKINIDSFINLEGGSRMIPPPQNKNNNKKKYKKRTVKRKRNKKKRGGGKRKKNSRKKDNIIFSFYIKKCYQHLKQIKKNSTK